jgi:hypothetical protein
LVINSPTFVACSCGCGGVIIFGSSSASIDVVEDGEIEEAAAEASPQGKQG